MMETEATQAIQTLGADSGLTQFLEQSTLWFMAGFALLFLRNTIENLLAGLFLFCGSSYDENMVCWLNLGGARRPARITKSSITSTTFFLYEIDEENGSVSGGTLLSVPNSELKNLRIERPLDKLDIPLTKKD
jgi:hypothetical protein